MTPFMRRIWYLDIITDNINPGNINIKVRGSIAVYFHVSLTSLFFRSLTSVPSFLIRRDAIALTAMINTSNNRARVLSICSE